MYCDYFTHFLTATIKCFEGHESNYEIPLNPKQQEALARFTSVMRGSDDDDNKLLSSLEEFLFLLCEEQPPVYNSEAWSCPVQCYWAMSGLRDDGNFIPPEMFTQCLAKTKHLCIITAAVDAVNHMSEYPNGLIGYVFHAFIIKQ